MCVPFLFISWLTDYISFLFILIISNFMENTDNT